MDSRNAIEVRNMYKQFKVQYDKANTLKDKILFWNRENRKEVHKVLNNINLNIKKGEALLLFTDKHQDEKGKPLFVSKQVYCTERLKFYL